MDHTNRSAFTSLMDAIKFAVESRKGKYSLETYLEIIGQYTDSVIREECRNSSIYRGGTCRACQDQADPSQLIFEVKMYFVNAFGQDILKEAQRKIPAAKFTSEALHQLQKERFFNIEKPS